MRLIGDLVALELLVVDQGSLRRVAVLLTSLDQATAKTLLSKMPPSRATQVRYAISQLRDVDPLERKMAIADFMQKSHAGQDPRLATTTHEGSESRFASPMQSESRSPNTPPPQNPASDPVRPEPSEQPGPLHFLNEIPMRALAEAAGRRTSADGCDHFGVDATSSGCSTAGEFAVVDRQSGDATPGSHHRDSDAGFAGD
ncbi:MAG: hypothetical protein R3C05_22285 [Pirellulaceae bacterium]